MQNLTITTKARVQLWREVRTQRSAWISLALALVLIVVGILIATRQGFVSDEIGINSVLLCSFVAPLFILGSECVAGELVRGTLSSLARTPGGLRAAFATKVCLFGLGVLLCTLAGPILYALAEAGTSAPAWWLFARPFKEPAVFACVVLPALGLGLWVFAASAWTPNGVLALPTALLLSVALGSAFWFAPRPFQEFALRGEDTLIFVPAYGIGGFLAARWSVVHGLVESSSRGRAALVGLRSSAWVVVPAFLLVALRPDLSSKVIYPSSLQIRNAVLLPSQDQLLLSVSQDSGFMPWIAERLAPLCQLWTSLPHEETRIERGVSVDLVNGEWSWSSAAPSTERKGSLREAWADWGSLPDLTEHGVSPEAVGTGWCGLGRRISLGPGKESLLWDPTRDLVVPYASVVDPDSPEQVLVRRTDWLVRRSTPEAEEPLTWFRYDPLLESWEEALGLGFSPLLSSLVLEDDRVIANEAVAGAVIVDPVTGTREVIHTPSGAVVEAIEGCRDRNGIPVHGAMLVNTWLEQGIAFALLEPDKAQAKLLTSPKHKSSPFRDRFLVQLADGRILVQSCAPARIFLSDPSENHPTQVFP